MLAACARIACMWLKCSAGVLLRVCACRGEKGGGSDPFSPAPSRRTPSRRAVRPSSRSRPTSTSRSRRQIVSFSPPRPPRRTRQCQNINVWWWRRMLSARAPRPPSRVPDQTHCTRSDWRSWRAREGPKRVINVASNVLHVPGKRVGRARAKTCQPSHACLFPVFQSLI